MKIFAFNKAKKRFQSSTSQTNKYKNFKQFENAINLKKMK